MLGCCWGASALDFVRAVSAATSDWWSFVTRSMRYRCSGSYRSPRSYRSSRRYRSPRRYRCSGRYRCSRRYRSPSKSRVYRQASAHRFSRAALVTCELKVVCALQPAWLRGCVDPKHGVDERLQQNAYACPHYVELMQFRVISPIEGNKTRTQTWTAQAPKLSKVPRNFRERSFKTRCRRSRGAARAAKWATAATPGRRRSRRRRAGRPRRLLEEKMRTSARRRPSHRCRPRRRRRARRSRCPSW